MKKERVIKVKLTESQFWRFLDDIRRNGGDNVQAEMLMKAYSQKP
jgi:hypothetical protein